MKDKLQKIARHPATKHALLSMKPEKTIWGILGVCLFFIAPEIIAFFWSHEIVHYAQDALLLHPAMPEKYLYELLIKLFEEGMNWFNLTFGIVLLIWLFF